VLYLELFEPHSDLQVRYDGPFAVRTPDFIERHETLVDALNAARALALSFVSKITLCPGEAGLHRINTPDNQEWVISSWQIDTSEGQPYINFTTADQNGNAKVHSNSNSLGHN